MRFWEFIDGYYLLQGLDLNDLFNKLPADRVMNIFESLAVEEAIRDGKAEGAIEKVRTRILKVSRTIDTPETDDLTETDPLAGWVVSDRQKVTGTFSEGVKVHNPSTFRLEPASDGSNDSPFA